MKYAEIEMPDGQRLVHDGRKWIYPDRETKAVVKYFAELVPQEFYSPDRLHDEIRFLLKNISTAKLIYLDQTPAKPDPGAIY